MRVGVDRVRGAVGGPAGVADSTHRVGDGLVRHQFLEIGDPTGGLDHIETLPQVQGDPGRVIPPVLEMRETWHENIDHPLRADVTDYSAHTRSTPFEVHGNRVRTESGHVVPLTLRMSLCSRITPGFSSHT